MQILKQLLENFNLINIFGNDDIRISSIEYNSKNVSQNTLFVAIKGENFDGHQFIPEAIDRGANAIVCEFLPDDLNNNITYIQVPNSRIALAELANAFYDFPSNKLKIIGITGTNGKTTITFLLNHMFQYFNKKTAIIGTTGIFIDNKKIPASHTTPESLELFRYLNQCVEQNIEYVSMEVSSHSLVQHRVHNINFVAASFTNLTLDHLDYHKTIQNYAKAKKMLFDNLQPDAIAVINNDDPFADYIIMDCKAKHIYRVGRQSDADYTIKNEKLSLKGVECDIVKNNITYKIQAPLLGKFNIDNLAQAFVIASELGFEPNEICKSLESATGARGRMEKYDLPNGALAIIDYAHTPDALEKALQSLKQIHNANSVDGKIICVFGCGGNRDKSKRPKMGKIACDFSDFVIITNDNPRNEDPQAIFNDILEGINIEMQNKVSIIPDRAEAIHSAIELSKENDIIFIAGKGHEEYQIIAGERRAFSDRQIVLDYCK